MRYTTTINEIMHTSTVGSSKGTPSIIGDTTNTYFKVVFQNIELKEPCTTSMPSPEIISAEIKVIK